ncbi:hypothetical protein KAW65_08150, partial [candidate division WOR-3 bacterium]|nr:hypothetical protein [candidate division WOR-3 bacterium]
CKMQNVKCKIEVEVKNLKEFKKAISYPVDRIMLDNMSITEIKKAVEMRNQLPKLEVSGGVNLDNVREIAKTGVDYISVGAITHSAKAIDMSLEILQIQTSTQIYTDDKDKHR